MRDLACLACLACMMAMLVAACAGDASDADYPVLPGGHGTGGFVDPSPVMLRGRVCRVTDLVQSAVCASTGAGGLTVSIGRSSAVTAEDGSFEVTPPTGSLLAFTVMGPGAITTTTPFSPSPTVPVVDADAWARALVSNQVTLPPRTGSILGTIVRDGFPTSGIFVESIPVGVAGPFFDAPDAGFALDATGARGAFFVPGIVAGGAALRLRDLATSNSSLVNGVTVIDSGVTILDSIVAP